MFFVRSRAIARKVCAIATMVDVAADTIRVHFATFSKVGEPVSLAIATVSLAKATGFCGVPLMSIAIAHFWRPVNRLREPAPTEAFLPLPLVTRTAMMHAFEVLATGRDTVMRTKRGGRRPTHLVTAEEIACWAYCPDQWRLQYGLGLPSSNIESLSAGDRHHARLARAERLATSSIVLGRVLAAIAVLAILALAALAP